MNNIFTVLSEVITGLVRFDSFVLLSYHDLSLISVPWIPTVSYPHSAVQSVWRINMFQCQSLVNKVFICCEVLLLQQVLIFDITENTADISNCSKFMQISPDFDLLAF